MFLLLGSVAKWLRQRIANPPSWVQLPPEPLSKNPVLAFKLALGFFVSGVGFFVSGVGFFVSRWGLPQARAHESAALEAETQSKALF